MKNLFLLIAISCMSLHAVSQAVTPFVGCGTKNIFFYKDGTNCTASPYSFNTIDLNGSLTNFGFLSGVGKEINAIGLNPVDQFAYGLAYDRTGSVSPCTFSNTQLVRIDAAGNMTDLGIVPPPAGGTVSNALGTISSQGQFIFYNTVNGNIYIGVISNIQSLTGTGSLMPFYNPIINNCPDKQIADWAISPTDGHLYSYAVFNDTIASIVYKRGVLVKININNLELTCQGNINTTEFLDPLRDNFGGVFFGADNFLYGVNVNTRKFYKIDPVNGDITLVSTIPGSGNMRADMGSCATAPFVLPIQLSNFNMSNKNCNSVLSWQLEGSDEVKEIIIETSLDGRQFDKIATVKERGINSYSTIMQKDYAYFRIAVISLSGSKTYSKIIYSKKPCGKDINISVNENPVRSVLSLNLNDMPSTSTKLEIYNSIGVNVLTQKTQGLSEKTLLINVNHLAAGKYYVSATAIDGTKASTTFIKN